MSETLTAAVVQAAPVLFDKSASVAKACRLVRDAAGLGARLVLFPEAFVPAYPRGLHFGAPVGARSEQGREQFAQYWSQSMDVPGPETHILGEAAKEAGVFLGIGVIEREGTHGGSLYCTLLLFGPSGDLLLRHRKLKPTAAERVIWGEGRGNDLDLAVTEPGKMGGLICWENYMPLARALLYQQGIDFYLAPTADARDSWQYTLCHIAREGGCFVLGCNQYVTKSMYPEHFRNELAGQPEEMCRGGSAIISPMGEVLAGPLYGEEGILIADLELDQIAKARFDFDPAGHYARPDVFQFGVRR